MNAALREFHRLAQRHDWPAEAVLQRRGSLWHSVGEQRAVSYPASYARELARVEDRSAWFRHRNRSIARVVRAVGLTGALWEVGAGNGIVAAGLADRGVDVVAVEPDTNAAAIAAARGVATIVGFFEDLHLPDRAVHAVGLFDVLEHLERPGELLAEVARVLVPGGTLFVSVPAYPCLWSPEDEAAGHFRRYTTRSLRAEVGPSGLELVRREFVFHSLVPAVLVARVLVARRRRTSGSPLDRIVAQLSPRSAIVSRLMRVVLEFEGVIDARWSPPFGTTILAAFVCT